MDEAFFEGFSQDLHDAARWEAFYRREQAKNPDLLPTTSTPPVPSIDAKWLFEEMMTASNHPDPWMFPALQRLREGDEYILAALSNTVIFPPGHKLHVENFGDDPVRRLFDVFVSSAHIGLRKPDAKAYRFALEQVDKFARDRADTPRGRRLGWDQGVQAEDVVFLDDIGENLKGAKALGFETVKVHLGRAFEAVDELERITGLRLAGGHARIPVKPNYAGTRAKM